MRLIHAITLVIFAVIQIGADQPAITADGKKVILFGNGTWRFAGPSDQVLFKNINQSINTESTNDLSEKNMSTVFRDNNQLSLIDIVKSDTNYDFRNVRWGMNRTQVLNAEKAKHIKANGEQLQYELEFLGYTCRVVYLFRNEKLNKAQLIIKQDHVDPALYFKDYEDLKRYLQPIYGSALSDKNEWKNEMYSGDRTKWGFAVSIGFLSCRTTWKNTRSIVSLNISGENHQITTFLEYSGMLP